MRLLVLGGTHHVGRAVVETALARGDEVTTLNRGLTGRQPPGARALHADRTDPAALAAPWAANPGTPSSTPGAARRAWWPTRPRCWLAGPGTTGMCPAGRCTGRSPFPGPTRARRWSTRTRPATTAMTTGGQARRRAGGGGGVRRPGAAGPGRPDPRPVRDRRADAVVAAAPGARRRGAGSRPAGPAVAVHRLPGPRGVDALGRRPRPRRRLQHGQPARSRHDGHPARGGQGGDRIPRDAGLGLSRGDRGRGHRAVDRAAGLGAALRRSTWAYTTPTSPPPTRPA